MDFLDKFFHLSEHGTNVRLELLAGLTTFLAMVYITVVNPSILSEAGMDFGAVFVATCLAAAFGSIAMGLLGNYPIAMAPGMGQNAFFTYSIVLGLGHSWQSALGAVFRLGRGTQHPCPHSYCGYRSPGAGVSRAPLVSIRGQ